MSAAGYMEAARMQQQQRLAGSSSSACYGGSSSGGVVVSETVRPFNSSESLDADLPLLVEHASALTAAQPAGHLIPTNVRPPQCLAAAGGPPAEGCCPLGPPSSLALLTLRLTLPVGSAYIPSSLTGSPFFHAAPSAPPCISRNPQAPTLAVLTNRLGAPPPAFNQQEEPAANIANLANRKGEHHQQQHQQRMQQQGSKGAAAGSSGTTGEQGAEPLCWPPPNSVSVGYGNIRSQMDAAGPAFASSSCFLAANNSQKAFSVISVPNQQAAMYNRAAGELAKSMKAMGCFSVRNPVAASLSKQLLSAKQQQTATPKEIQARTTAAQAPEAARAAERQQREAEEAAAKAEEEERQKQQAFLKELDVSQLLCSTGPSPAELRAMRAREAALWRQQQQQQEQMQQQQQRQMELQQQYLQQQEHFQQQQLQQQQQYAFAEDYYYGQQHQAADLWSQRAAQPDAFPAANNALHQQADREFLQSQILLQEQRISELHEQLMQHQQTREQRRKAAAAAAAGTSFEDAQLLSFSGEAENGFPAGEQQQPVGPKGRLQQQGSLQNQQLARHFSSSTKESSRQTSDEQRPKNMTVDAMLEQFLKAHGLEPSVFRRVRSGVYFYGRTKVVMKVQRGQLSCMPLHLTHEQQQNQQQRFLPIDRFLREQGPLPAKA
ncbi:hypothetical protein Efla_000267 [Eimeria flavescens]